MGFGLLLALLSLLLAVGCGGGSAATPAPLQATGIVISTDGSGVANVTRFRLRTADGQELDFRVGVLDLEDGGLPAPHLREHMASGEPIEVSYHIEDGVNVADRYVDAH